MHRNEPFGGFAFRLFSFARKHQTDNSRGTLRHYIGYLYRGTAQIVCDDECLELNEGDLFYIPKGCRYRSYWSSKDEIRFDSFAFDVFPQETVTPYRLQKFTPTESMKKLHENLAKNRKVDLRSIGTLYLLLGEILPYMKAAPFQKNDALAEAISNYIFENPNALSEETARRFGVSQSTMYHLLRQKLNTSPNQIRQKGKCQQAVNLLTCTDLSVEEVCIQLGFSSSSYMRKILRAHTGKTPLQIRKSAQNL